MTDKEKPFYILSCNGGGVKGLASVSFLYHMCKYMKTIDLNFKLYDFFDMYAGTSIGAIIIGLFLVNKYDEEQLIEHFNKDNCKRMIDKTIWDKMLGVMQNRPKYDGIDKKKLINEYIGNHNFSSFEKHVIIPAYNITERRARVFDSKICNDKVLTSTIIDASSAAPAYFPCVQINNCNKKQEECKNDWFIDGGVFANNPTISAISKARKILKGTNREIIVVNIFTGYKNETIDGKEAENYGGPEWLIHDILGIAMDESIMEEQAKDLLNENCYININDSIPNCSDDLDDVSDNNMDSLIKAGELWWLKHKYKFDKIFNI